MTNEPRKRGWAWWTAATLLLVLLYPLSIGPAWWLDQRHMLPGSFVWTVYGPILSLDANGPEWFGHAIRWYVNLWSN